MRFIANIIMKGRAPFLLPLTYRKDIIKLIKEAIRCSKDAQNIYKEYWGDLNTYKVKPFTFYLYTPHSRYITFDDSKFLQLNVPSIRLYISSSDFNFLSILHKGLLSAENSFTLFNYSIELNSIYLKKVKLIHSNPVKFKILSPIVVRNMEITGNDRRKRCKGYLSCNDCDFKNSLISSIRTLCSRLLNNTDRIKTDNIEVDTSLCIPTSINHYQEYIPATKGVIEIRADKDILELVYNAGMGARRSQGFGMVELLREDKHKYIS